MNRTCASAFFYSFYTYLSYCFANIKNHFANIKNPIMWKFY